MINKREMGKIVSFLKPNLENNNVAANESESAEDSLFTVEIRRIKTKTAKFRVELLSRYFNKKQKKIKRKKYEIKKIRDNYHL